MPQTAIPGLPADAVEVPPGAPAPTAASSTSASGGGVTPPPSVVPAGLPADAVLVSPNVTAPGRPSILTPPPSTAGMPALPLTGPAHPFIDRALPAFNELAGALVGGSSAESLIAASPVLTAAARVAPRLVRAGAAMFAAGAGGATGRAIGQTLTTPPPVAGQTAGSLVVDTAKDLTGAFATNAVGEGLAQGAGRVVEAVAPRAARVVNAITAPIRRPVTPEGALATEMLHGQVTGAQQTDSYGLGLLDKIMQSGIFSGGKYAAFMKTQQARLSGVADSLIAQFGPRATQEEAGQAITAPMHAAAGQTAADLAAARTGLSTAQQTAATTRAALPETLPREQAGRLVQAAREQAYTVAKDAASQLYKDVDTLGQGVTVSLQPLRDFIDEEAGRRGALATALTGGKTASVLKTVDKATTFEDSPELLQTAQFLHTTPEELRANPARVALLHTLSEANVSTDAVGAGQVTFTQAHEIRSALGRLIRDADASGNSQLRGVAAQLQKRIDASMTTAANGSVVKPVGGVPATSNVATQLSHVADQPRLQDLTNNRYIPGGKLPTSLAGLNKLRNTLENVPSTEAGYKFEDNPAYSRAYSAVDDAIQHLDAGFDSATAPKAVAKSPLRTAYDQATSAYKSMMDTFERGILSEIAVRKPRQVVSYLVQPGAVADLQKVRDTLSPEAFAAVQRAHLGQLLTGAKGGPVTGSELAARLAKLTPETIDALYGKATAGQIAQYTQALTDTDTLAQTVKGLEKQTGARIPSPIQAFAAAIRPHDVAGVEKIRAIIGDDAFKQVQSAYAQKLLLGHTGQLKTGQDLLATLTTESPETLKAAFPRGGDNGFWQLARVLDQITPKKTISGGLSLGLRMGQGTALLGVVGAGVAGLISPKHGLSPERATAAGLLLLSPSILAHVLLSPGGRTLLTSGLRATASGNVGTATRAGTQLFTMLVRDGLVSSQGTPPAPARAQGAGPRGIGTAGGPPPGLTSPPPPGR